MSTTVIILIVALIVVAAVAGWALWQKRRSEMLKTRFGPEYQHAVYEYGDRTRAEAALEKRAERTEKYHIRPLTHEDRDTFADEWRKTQARFVDEPRVAVREADRLVCDVMRRRGYPMGEFERRAEDLSVDHPHVVRNYRAAHQIAQADERGEASTEDLRQCMVYYRDLFDELLETHPAGHHGGRK